jgi:hypothetical protein
LTLFSREDCAGSGFCFPANYIFRGIVKASRASQHLELHAKRSIQARPVLGNLRIHGGGAEETGRFFLAASFDFGRIISMSRRQNVLLRKPPQSPSPKWNELGRFFSLPVLNPS